MDMPRTEEFTEEMQLPIRITIADIKKVVARDFGLQVEDLTSKKRSRHLARPRQVAMYLARMFTPRSYPEIGSHFGGRDHSTVIHACRLIPDLLKREEKENLKLRKKVEALIRQFHYVKIGGAQLVLPFLETQIFFSLRKAVHVVSSDIPCVSVPESIDDAATQLNLGFTQPQEELRPVSLVPFIPQKPAQITNAEIIKVVADYYVVSPHVLEREPENDELRFYHEVIRRLRLQLPGKQLVSGVSLKHSNNAPHYLLKNDTDLISYDVKTLWDRMNSQGYIPLV